VSGRRKAFAHSLAKGRASGCHGLAWSMEGRSLLTASGGRLFGGLHQADCRGADCAAVGYLHSRNILGAGTPVGFGFLIFFPESSR
jgi:hypothetical protein